MDAGGIVTTGDPAGADACRGVAVVGLGNIGSNVVPLLSGMPQLERVLLIDGDRYETEANLGHQRFAPSAAGRSKAAVQAQTLRRLVPHVEVRPLPRLVEDVPWGAFRGLALLSCVDSRRSRQWINEIAFAVGSPWIDAAVDGGLRQVRCRPYLPGKTGCLECAWSQADFDRVEQIVPCAGAERAPVRTAAPIELGGLAASLMVGVLRELLDAGPAAVSPKQMFYDVANRFGWAASYAVNPGCRLDHRPMSIAPLTGGVDASTLRDVFGLVPDANGIVVQGQRFVRRLVCPGCGAVRNVGLKLSRAVRDRRCRCGRTLVAPAPDAVQVLARRAVRPRWLDRPLRGFGIEPGDVLGVLREGGDIEHCEVEVGAMRPGGTT